MKIEIAVDPAGPFIARTRLRHYLRASMIRLLSSLLAAMALLLSPLAIWNGAAMAMPHGAATAAAAVTPGDCGGEEAPADDGNAPAKAGCASGCAAVQPVCPDPFEESGAARDTVALRGAQVLSGVHPEGETPPPRITREI